MNVKVTTTCKDCGEVISENILAFNELKFKHKAEEQPNIYMYEQGPDYEGVFYKDHSICMECK